MGDSATDLGSWIADPGTGELRPAFPVVVEDVAVGSRGTIKRGRRREAWEGVNGITQGMHQAAMAFRQAAEHCQCGKGMGPMPWGGDTGRSTGARLLAQERALSAAAIYRRGVQAMGLQASQSVVQWVVLDGRSLTAYDRRQRWRKGRGAEQLVAALERMAREFGCE